MAQLTPASGTARFGPYEVDPRSGEMRKFGIRIKLGEQPLRILLLLIERHGELVTREELRRQLWSQDTFVDFDHSLNSAVQRLRESLSDTAGKAHWIETVPRRGYRFVGAVEWTNPNGVVPPLVNAITAGASDVTGGSAVKMVPEPAAAEDTGSNRWSWRFAGAGIALLLVVAVLVWVWQHKRSVTSSKLIRSLAVLPLENLSSDPAQEYFVDGMTDDVITALAKNHSLRVISRTSTMQYKKVRRPVRDIARELGVDGILEGSVTRLGDRVHLTVQLVQASSDTHVWAESYDRDFKELTTLPTDLAQTIAKEVRVAVSAPGPQRYVDPAAHDAYLRGRYLWFSDNSRPSVEFFQQAVRIQPDYAAAWSGLSDYYGGRAVGGQDPPAKYRSDWEADARQAVELDDSLADEHNSMAAWYFFGAWDLKRAEAESLRAIALNPNYGEAYHVYSYILMAENRSAEAVEIQKNGAEVDPFSRPWALGYTYYRLRQFDAAVSELRVREQAFANNLAVRDILSDAYHSVGLDKEALGEWEQMFLLAGETKSAAAIRRTGARGYVAAAEWRLQHDKATAAGNYLSPFWLALRAARANHREETLRLLEESYRDHSPRLIFVQNEPAFDFLHAEPRYQEIVRQVGLPVAR